MNAFGGPKGRFYQPRPKAWDLMGMGMFLALNGPFGFEKIVLRASLVQLNGPYGADV